MKRLGIIQPGKIGDIIICLPIAKWYYDRGYEIIWPVDRNIIDNFVDYIEYVTFIPIDFDCRVANQVCFNNMCNKILDLSFTIPGASTYNSDNYLKQDIYSFDEYKYFLADVPFEEKWNLNLKRNMDKELSLQKKLNIREQYVIIQENSSDYVRKVQWENDQFRRIDFSILSTSVFDWLSVLEKASQHILIESCLVNLVDQLNITVDKHTLLLKHGYYGRPLVDERLRGIPVFRKEWVRI
jgi:hypothetical protein